MHSKYAIALTLMLVFATAAFAGGLADLVPLYDAGNLAMLLNDPNVKTELKITKEQEKGVKTSLDKWKKASSRDDDTIYKMKGPKKEAKIRALGTQRSDALLQSLGQVLDESQVTRLKQIALQRLAMGLFDHQEIREALKLGDKEVDTLKTTFKKLRDDIVIEVKAGRLSKDEGYKQWLALGNTVPDGVRAQLTAPQRRTLNDLLGEPYVAKKP